MTTDTKVAELPAKWRGYSDVLVDGGASAEIQMSYAFERCALQLEAALARQEADNASSPNVIYRWRALDYSGFCYGSNPPHDLPSEACLTAFYRDPEGLRSALHEISATGNMTATDKQFSRHLQQIARDALAGAAPPSAPVGQEAVAWRYWSPSGSCWWTRYVAPTEDTSPESTNWEPLYAAQVGQKERDKAIWRAAITLANNICVQECDRLNDDDASCEAIDATNKCARRIRGYVEPDTEQLAEMFAEASVPHAPPAAQAVDLEQLRRALCVIGEVGEIDGHGVIRRNSMLEIVGRFIDQQAGKGGA